MQDLVDKINKKKEMERKGIYDDGTMLRVHVNARTLRGRNYYLTKSATYRGDERKKQDIMQELEEYAHEIKSHPDHIRWMEYKENKSGQYLHNGKPSRTGVPNIVINYHKGNNQYRLMLNVPGKLKGKSAYLKRRGVEESLVSLDILRSKVTGSSLLTPQQIAEAVDKINIQLAYHKEHGVWMDVE